MRAVYGRVVTQLPLIDRPAVEIAAPPAATWDALVEHLGGELSGGALTAAFVRVIGVRHPAPSGRFPETGSTIRGFQVAASEPPRRLLLEGSHRFSVYELEFAIEPRADGVRSELTAITRAKFPGIGRLYRMAVIGAGPHRVLTGRMLRAVRKRAEGA